MRYAARGENARCAACESPIPADCARVSGVRASAGDLSVDPLVDPFGASLCVESGATCLADWFSRIRKNAVAPGALSGFVWQCSQCEIRIEPLSAVYGVRTTDATNGEDEFLIPRSANYELSLKRNAAIRSRSRRYLICSDACRTRFAAVVVRAAEYMHAETLRIRAANSNAPKLGVNPESRAGFDPAAAMSANGADASRTAKYRGPTGHGFAAEDANTLSDRLRFRDAETVGGNNVRNGPDRLVDGVSIQSKYHRTARRSVSAAFDRATGEYRYAGQTLEVPRDQYAESVCMMRQKIREGKVPDVRRVTDAEKIVRRGNVTYAQARNMARAGNIHSIAMDAKTGAVTGGAAFGISFAITYARARQMGMSREEALRQSLAAGFRNGAGALAAHIAASQFSRTAAGRAVDGASKKAADAVAGGARAATRNRIGRTAANRIGTAASGNIAGRSAIAAITFGPDFYRVAFDGSISWRQFLKNGASNAAGLGGAAIGGKAGALAGGFIGSAIPIVGTAVGIAAGGVIGGAIGGIAAGFAAKKAADAAADDDAVALMKSLDAEIQSLAHDFMLDQKELNDFAKSAKQTITPKWLRRMYKETDDSETSRRAYVRTEFEPEFLKIARARPQARPPTAAEFRAAIAAETT